MLTRGFSNNKCLAILIVLAISLTSGAALSTNVIGVSAETLPRFEPTPCPVTLNVAAKVECGFVSVAEQHKVPASRTIRLMIAIVRSNSINHQPDPVIYLSGGPGSRTLDSFVAGLGSFLESQLTTRDIILVDQRGMGYSEPSTNCPEVDALKQRTEQGPYDADNEAAMLPIKACLERLQTQGITIGAYNTLESAADVVDIAIALDYSKINIYAGSYGSTLAMTVMRHHPELLRSVVLMGITPPQVDLMASFAPNLERALNLVFETCIADERCRAAYPNLREMYRKTTEELNENPLRITTVNPLTNAPSTYILNGNDFNRGLQFSMYNSSSIPMIPAFIASASAGQTEAFTPLIQAIFMLNAGTTEGSYLAMRCMDDVHTTTPQAWEGAIAQTDPLTQRAFRPDIEYWAAICADWAPQKLDPVENTPVISDVPTLIMNGGFDPVTPPNWGKLAVETLSRGFNYDFPESAHGVYPSPCAVNIFRAFLLNPLREPNTQCIADLPPVEFVVP